MLPKIITTADTHLRNSDPYGIYDDRGINDFLLYRRDAFTRIINRTIQEKAHLAIAGDFLDGRTVDSHTLYYSSEIISLLNEIEFVVLIEGNHGFDDKRGMFSVIAHWKHLSKDNVRIVTYPKVERHNGVAYHCIPAISDADKNFKKIVGSLNKESKKSDKVSILLLHGGVTGALFESGKQNSSGIPLNLLQKYRKYYQYIVCGDFHRYQVLDKNIWYCGSIIQASLKDKNQKRGYQIIDPNKDTVEFVSSKGPKFIELECDATDYKSILVQSKKFKNSITIVRLNGTSYEIDKVDKDSIKSILKSYGCIRVFVDTKTSSENKNRVVLNKDMSEEELIQSFCKSKEELPAPLNEVVEKGLVYLR